MGDQLNTSLGDRAWPGEAMPGPCISLTVFRRRASRSGAGRAVRGRKTQGNADAALIRLLTSNKDSGTRHSAVRATVSERIRQLVVFTPASCPDYSVAFFLNPRASAHPFLKKWVGG